jgi:hypothetical protein
MIEAFLFFLSIYFLQTAAHGLPLEIPGLAQTIDAFSPSEKQNF